jgi:nucleotide-binding universal stress UspA family protein
MEKTMTYKTILVHLDDRARRAERLQLGFQLADRFEAHLVALFTLDAARIPSYALAEAGPIVRDIEGRRRSAAARDAEADFRRAQVAGGKAELRLSQDDALPVVRDGARYADLVILGQPEPGDAAAKTFCEELLLSAGRPLLFVPHAGHFPEVGRRVLVAWNTSREAARAVSDALPLLARAESVEVVAFDSAGGGEVPRADIALYLARHGVKATAARQRGPGVEIGAQILSRAADASADLIVMGGYGHSRLRELALGGATRSVLQAMTMPVLMAH